jgi:hypothetical protein
MEPPPNNGIALGIHHVVDVEDVVDGGGGVGHVDGGDGGG